MNYENIKVTQKNETSEVEITGTIPTAALSEYRKKALKDIVSKVDIAGFRKGHVPEKIVIEKVGEVYILEESAELALKEVAPEIIEKNAPRYVGRPEISITKLAPENPVEFKILVGVLPEVPLPDYKNLAKTALESTKKDDEKIEVSEAEIDKVIEDIRGQHAHQEFHKINADKLGHEHDDEEINKLKPEFTDEFVKTVGNFESIADFRVKAKESMIKEKETKVKDKKRSAILEKLVSETTLTLPASVINNEIEKMFAQFQSDVQGVGLKMEDYLKHINKTAEDLAKDWKPDAEKRAKLNLILEEIAKKENIEADQDLVKQEVAHLTSHYKDVDPLRAALYTEHMLKIEKTIKFLEEQK